MRVLEICTRFVPGGIQRHVLDLAGWLRGEGHDVTLGGTPGPWAGADDPQFLAIDCHNVAAEGGSLPRRLVHLVRAAARLRSELARRKIELIHAHESAPGLVAGLAALGTDIPVLITFHGAAPERIPEFARIARAFARLVITPSHHSAADLAAAGLPRDRLRVIGLGIKPAERFDPAEIAALRQDLLGAEGQTLILTVARLAHQKGIDHLVEIARRATAADPGLRFVLVGDGPQCEEAKQWAAAAGLGERLHFAGHSDRPQAFMAAADLFLLPSRWESLPITIAEAFQQGLPVIATDCGGVSELVDDTVGRLTRIGDIAALTEAVLTLAHDEPSRQSLAAAARARSAEPRFQPAHIHAQFAALYREVLGRP